MVFDFLMQIAPFKLHVPFSRFTSETRLVKSVDFIVCHCQHLDFKFLWQTTDNKIKGSPCNYYSLELAQPSQSQEMMKTMENFSELDFPLASQSRYLPCSKHGCFRCVVHLHFALGTPEFHILMLGLFWPATSTEPAPVP